MSTDQGSLFDPINIKIVQNPDLGDNMAKITVMGIGGGGCNMVDNYISKNQYKIKLIAANTDNQVLHKSNAPIKIQLGPKTTKGLGAGMNPVVGQQAAVESTEDIKKELDGSDMVFLCAGLGGGTGSGAIPVIARIARDLGILTVGVVTIPFNYEMGRESIAYNALDELKINVDSYLVIYNDKILEMVPPTTGIQESFKIIDNVLYDTVNGMCEIILNYKKLNMNVDFADISTTLTRKGLSLIGIGHKSGENSGIRALNEAINSPLLNINSIRNAKTIIIHFKFSPDYPIQKMSEVMNQVKNSADLGAKCIVGTVYDEDMKQDEVKVTLIATGFDTKSKENKQLKEELIIQQEPQIEDGIISKFLKKWF